MDITNKIDMLLSEEKKWFSSMGNNIYRDMDKKTQVEVMWRPGQKEVKVQFRDSDSREYIGHTMVSTKGMKSKEFLKHVDKDMKNIWSTKKKGMKEEHINEDVYDAEAIVGKKRITKPMSAKSEEDAKKQFKKFLEGQMKNGHIDKGEIKNIKAKKA